MSSCTPSPMSLCPVRRCGCFIVSVCYVLCSTRFCLSVNALCVYEVHTQGDPAASQSFSSRLPWHQFVSANITQFPYLLFYRVTSVFKSEFRMPQRRFSTSLALTCICYIHTHLRKHTHTRTYYLTHTHTLIHIHFRTRTQTGGGVLQPRAHRLERKA